MTVALARLEQGNTSGLKGVGKGMLECRIDFGPGYRVYLGRDGETRVILLTGGTKKRQQRISTRRRRCGRNTGGASRPNAGANEMALTRDFKELVQRQVVADPAYGEALLRENIDTTLAGEVHTGKASQGAGLGKVLSAEEGRARIVEYATPTRVKDWAGPLAGPTELERDFGVARSALHTWQRQGVVIGLLVGVRKHAFPTEQFVDGRPVTGLGEVVEVIGDLRAAWLWLREPNPGLAGVTPLARLKAGATDKVVEMARSNFADA